MAKRTSRQSRGRRAGGKPAPKGAAASRKPPRRGPKSKSAGVKASTGRTGRAGKGRPKPPPAEAAPTAAGELLDADRAISLLKTTRATFYRWLRAGKIKGMKLGRQWRFYKRDIERFLKGQEPQVELPADIGPLIRTLSEALKKAGGVDARRDVSPVQRAAALTILLGDKMRASDIHFEPFRQDASLRVRVDGVLHQIARFDLQLLPAIAERFKQMAACDVLEKHLPQDGRIMVSLGGKELDLRVSFLPALMGEAITLRVLRPDEEPMSLDGIDYSDADRERLLRALNNPWGLIVVAGPTGCGKTTVLYACLRHLAKPGVKLMSIEDPVEYLIPGVVQAAVREQAGFTLERAVRAFLRSDPDVILIGEVRNRETLELAHQAALTGHLILTTLHTSAAADTLKRMLDIGLPPFLVADATRFVSVQRLVRRLCRKCSQPAEPAEDQLAMAEKLAGAGGLRWSAVGKNFREPVGCPQCGRTGYRGRTLIVEMLEVTPEVGQAVRGGASADELRQIAIGQGMTTMAADGIRRAAAGQTSLEEVFRVLSVG